MGGEGYFCYLVPCLLGRDLFIIKGNQVLADKLTFFLKKSVQGFCLCQQNC